jgi:two-component system LytT family sensor kinase
MIMILQPSSSRYTLKKVFWVVLAVYMIFFGVGIILSFFSPYDIKFSSFFTGEKLLRECIKIVLIVCYFYVTLNHFNKLIVERKGFFSWLPAIILAVIAVGAYHCLMYFVFHTRRELEGRVSAHTIIFSYTLSTLLTVGFNIMLAYWNNLRDEKQQRKLLEAQKLELEAERSQANFNFLKAQINPHFLHNTLNFLYAKSLPYSEELSEGILTLSDIMRYALSEGNASDGQTLLKDEIEHVRNVIKINQLRFSNNLNVQFNVNGVVNGWTIIPFVLITLVENAFKHGDLKNTESPIVVNLDIESDRIFFFCKNKKKTGPKELSTGIGLENIRKRLELAYGSNHKLNIIDQDEFYTTELTIYKL